MEPEDQTETQTETKNTNSVPVIVGVVVLLIVLGAVFFANSKKSPNQTVNLLSRTNVQGESTATAVPAGPVKEFMVNGTNFAFDPKIITVKKGDTIKITFKDTDGAHNLVINGYNVSTNVIGEGSQDTIQFVADKAGTFEYYCSVGGHREAGMVGTLTVE